MQVELISSSDGQELDLHKLIIDLSNEKVFLTQNQLDLLIKNRDKHVPELLKLFDTNFNLVLLKNDEAVDIDSFYWSTVILGLLKEKEAFHSFRKLFLLKPDEIDYFFGDDFVTSELPYILALTGDDAIWHLLEGYIRNSNFDVFVRDACLRACIVRYAYFGTSRKELVAQLKELLQTSLEKEIIEDGDKEWNSLLVSSVSDAWPSECLEEVKELLGRDSIDFDMLDIDNVLSDLKKGKAGCINDLIKWIERFYGFYLPKRNSMDEAQANDIENKILARRTSIGSLFKKYFEVPKQGRNELCHCGSGRKVKKCCLLNSTDTVLHEGYTVVFDQLKSPKIAALSSEDKDIFDRISWRCANSDVSVLPDLVDFMQKHSEVESLHNYLFVLLKLKGQHKRAFEVLKNTVELFPKYLFGLAEYAQYFLHRGEPERIAELFNHCWTLRQFYPERVRFHVAEVQVFSFIMARYFIAIEKFDSVRPYYLTIKKSFPDESQVELVEREIRRKLGQHVDPGFNLS